MRVVSPGSPPLYSMASATLSGVIGPAFTEIHKSSLFSAFFFFFFLVSDLPAVAIAPLRRQQQQRRPSPSPRRRQQQQWQQTTREVSRTTRGSASSTARHAVLYAPCWCLSMARLHSRWKKSTTACLSMASGREGRNGSHEKESAGF